MVQSQVGAFRRRLFVALPCLAMLAGMMIGIGARPAAAEVTAVKGSACSYFVKVGLFGGPQQRQGCPPQTGFPPPGESSLAPFVTLPEGGSATAITASDADGARAKYGPAVIHGGIWPDDVALPTASGPQFASTVGTPGTGTVTSIAEIKLRDQPYPQVACYEGFEPPCEDPGGFGPAPVWGDSLKAECTATESGVTGKTTFSKAFLATATDSGGSPLASATEPIPDNPPPNYTRSGVITNVGDVFSVVFNQQIVNGDGSLTVNAVHMYLFGPTAIGEVVRGQVTCGTTPSSAVSNDTVAPACGTAVVEPISPEDPTPKTPRVERVGVFDAGTGDVGTGIDDVINIQANNATVELGNPNPAYPQYTRFTDGQTGPLPITATRIDESLPMSWSFDVVDKAGNTVTCRGVPGTPPVAVDDTYSTKQDKSLTVGAPGVLANDTDTRPLTVGSASDPPGGSVSLAADGSFTYTPDTEFSGTDTFTYALSNDQGGLDSGTVTVSVDAAVQAANVGTTTATTAPTATTATTATTRPSTTAGQGANNVAGASVLGSSETRSGRVGGGSDTLPRTGAEPLQPLRAALLLILGGSVLVLGATRHHRLRRIHRLHG